MSNTSITEERLKSILISSNIHFFSEEVDFSLSNTKEIIAWLVDTALQEKSSIESVNYIFCSDEYLLKINQDHLDHDYYTDVISFPYNSNPIEGDIYISVDRIKDNAQKLGLSFDNEMHRVMIHGLLHFLGYGDANPEEKTEMTNKENFYLNQLSL